ncbi:MAG: hypothetical protein EOO15_22460, partial [Chitinophagaceae bacterium]
PVLALKRLPDGRLLVGGDFDSTRKQPLRHLVALKEDGGIDRSFSNKSAPNGSVCSILLQADGKLLVSGNFNFCGNAPHDIIARFGPDGRLDQSFQAGSFTWAIRVRPALQPDGRILVYGFFETIQEQKVIGLARLLQNGTLDTTFNHELAPNRYSTVYALAVRPDGGIVCSSGEKDQSAENTTYWVRHLLPSGKPDPDFVVSKANERTSLLAIDNEGALILGGAFTYFGGSNYRYLIRMEMNRSTTAQ